jgi:hypothetical protein
MILMIEAWLGYKFIPLERDEVAAEGVQESLALIASFEDGQGLSSNLFCGIRFSKIKCKRLGKIKPTYGYHHIIHTLGHKVENTQQIKPISLIISLSKISYGPSLCTRPSQSPSVSHTRIDTQA